LRRVSRKRKRPSRLPFSIVRRRPSGNLRPLFGAQGASPRGATLRPTLARPRLLGRRLVVRDLTRSDIHDELGELRRISRALGALPCGHVAGRGSAAFIIPSANRPGFHFGICRGLLCLVAHTRTMARARQDGSDFKRPHYPFVPSDRPAVTLGRADVVRLTHRHGIARGKGLLKGLVELLVETRCPAFRESVTRCLFA
jgi:hypothetical protein